MIHWHPKIIKNGTQNHEHFFFFLKDFQKCWKYIQLSVTVTGLPLSDVQVFCNFPNTFNYNEKIFLGLPPLMGALVETSAFREKCAMVPMVGRGKLSQELHGRIGSLESNFDRIAASRGAGRICLSWDLLVMGL